MPKVTLNQRSLDYEAPARLSELLSQLGAPVEQPCGGRGSCGKCRVRLDGREVLACQTTVDGDVTVELPAKTHCQIQVGGELPAFRLDPWAEGQGVAIDIGTTTMAAYLYELKSGAQLAQASSPNPQSAFGADVITRMQKAEEGQADALKLAIVDGVKALISALCVPDRIGSLVLTGNTAMLYLLTGQDPAPILRAPFLLSRPFGEYMDPAAFGLPGMAKVYLPACVSAYVGADIGCAMLAAGLFAAGRVYGGKPVLLIDIGTNGEIVLCANGRLLACSTAAGPAFEGAGICQGMAARDGAVAHVSTDGRCEVIGGGSATGICGSGIVDAMAYMAALGVIDETGLLNDDPWTLPGTSVSITQADVRAVQLAKAAICAGMLTLLDHARVDPADVERLLIAGGFGSYIDPKSAERIGLIPEGFAGVARAIGNASGMGASMALLSSACLDDTKKASAQCETVELASNPVFMEHYVERMMFP